jgi:hypothetical protein
MTTISQLPASFTFNGVAGNPATIQFDVNLTDSTGASISWSQVTGYQVDLADEYGNLINGASPSVSSPSANIINVGWTASQTVLINAAQRPRMALSIFLQSSGPYTLLAGPLNFSAPEYPAATYS